MYEAVEDNDESVSFVPFGSLTLQSTRCDTDRRRLIALFVELFPIQLRMGQGLSEADVHKQTTYSPMKMMRYHQLFLGLKPYSLEHQGLLPLFLGFVTFLPKRSRHWSKPTYHLRRWLVLLLCSISMKAFLLLETRKFVFNCGMAQD